MLIRVINIGGDLIEFQEGLNLSLLNKPFNFEQYLFNNFDLFRGA